MPVAFQITTACHVIAGIVAMLIALRRPSAGRFIALALAVQVPEGLFKLAHSGLGLDPTAVPVILALMLDVATYAGRFLFLYMGLRAAVAPRRVTLLAVTFALAILSYLVLLVGIETGSGPTFTMEMGPIMTFLAQCAYLSGAVIAWLGARTDRALRWVALGLLVPGLNVLRFWHGFGWEFTAVALALSAASLFLLLYGASRLGQSKETA